ncbi:hypothetical protein FACS1894182_01020 [Bacteroidia bacterium]|nr:hypothetical protein FACS1894182_01020 [Bacteroidia bacterium]
MIYTHPNSPPPFPKIEWYKITSVLSTAGGMSEIYRAMDLRSHREVAIKRLKLQGNISKRNIQMFKREGDNYVRLNHPRLMKLIDYAEQEDGYYLVMELIPGMSLAERLHTKTGPMPAERAIPLFLQVLETIGYLHSKNILHLDIKPANIMVQEDDSIKIIDMGISADLNNIDKFVKRTGTPSCMSPEQLQDGQTLGYYTDIWALGITLFKILTCQEPFAGTNRNELNHHICYSPTPRAADFYSDVSDDIQRVLEKALAKNPQDRYNSCAEFADDLLKIQYGQPGLHDKTQMNNIDKNMRVLTIGRDATNDIRFADDPHVTRSCHCQLIKEDDESYTIFDFSSNGTFVNNKRIPKGVPVKLGEYDIIRIGSITPPLRWKDYFKKGTTVFVTERGIGNNEFNTTQPKPVPTPQPVVSQPVPDPQPTPLPEKEKKKTDWGKIGNVAMRVISVIMTILGLLFMISRFFK